MLTLAKKHPSINPVAAKSATGIGTPCLIERTDAPCQRLFLCRDFVASSRKVLNGDCAAEGQPQGWSDTRSPIVPIPTLYSSHPYLIGTGKGGVLITLIEDTTMPPLSVCGTSVSIRENHYSLNDLHRASGAEDKHKPSQFLRLEQTQELITEIEKGADSHLLAVEIIKGRNGGTFVCRELVYAYAMWISPKFNLAVIRAFDAIVIGHKSTNDKEQSMKELPQPAQWYLAKMEGGAITKMVAADVPCIAKYIATHHPDAIVINKDAMYENLMQLAKLASDTAAQFRDDNKMEQRWQQLSESVA